MKLVGSNPSVTSQGTERLPGQVSYFFGNDPRKWRTNVPTFGRVKYVGVYPGVDLVYYGAQNQLEYDFIVQPGADPKQIRLAYSGAEQVELDAKGDLVLHAAGGEVRQHKPVVYQEIHGRRVPVSGDYVLRGGVSGRMGERESGGKNERTPSPTHPYTHTPTQVSFRVAEYDRSRPLIIDPVLSYSTFLGGRLADEASSIAIDGNELAYVTGWTGSTDFPTTAGKVMGDPNDGPIRSDVFIVKLDLTKTGDAGLLYSTYLGGDNDDYGQSIVVDESGNAYVAGYTLSTDFPTTPGAMTDPGDDNPDGLRSLPDAFVVKLDPTGSGSSALHFSTYLGGSDADAALGIALDPAGNVCVTGYTFSPDFPTTAGAIQGDHPDVDAFVAKLDLTKTGTAALLSSTYLGGDNQDYGNGIAVDNAGIVYVAGDTLSSDFPTTPDRIMGDFGENPIRYDGFVTKLDLAQSGADTLLYSTYLSGNDTDTANALVVDGGYVYVTGRTFSTDFPTTPDAFQGDQPGEDIFITKLDLTRSGTDALVYSTYLGGNADERSNSIALDRWGRVYVTGATNSRNFPTTGGAVQGVQGSHDAILVSLDLAKSGASALVYGTYLGGDNLDEARSVVVDGSGNAYLAGWTSSANFPTTPDAYQRAPAGQYPSIEDAFVVKLDPIRPAMLTGLAAAAASETEIDLSWTHNGVNTLRYEVYRRPGGGSYSLAGTVKASLRTFQDVGLTPGTVYGYFVRAVSAESYVDSQEVTQGTPPIPAVPGNLQAAVFPGARLRLSWEESDPNTKEFHLERKTDSTAYAEIAVLGSRERTYFDETVAPSTRYTYQVRAMGVTLFSDYSNTADVVLPPPPGTPTRVGAQPYSSTQVRVDWSPASAPAPYQYRIERKSAGGSFQEVGQVRGNVYAFVDGNLTGGTLYTYRVRAAIFGAFSNYSNTADATPPVMPNAPLSLSAEPVSATQLRLTLTPGGGPVTYFRVERFFGGSFVEVGRVRSTETAFLEGGLAPATAYRYRVRAVNGVAVSPSSPEAQATTRAVPGAPTGLNAQALSGGRIRIAFTPGPGEPTGFLLERKEGASWVEAGQTPASRPGFIDAGRLAGVTYTYRVRALSGTARSAPSLTASAIAMP
jgi:hypothetical protein